MPLGGPPSADRMTHRPARPGSRDPGAPVRDGTEAARRDARAGRVLEGVRRLGRADGDGVRDRRALPRAVSGDGSGAWMHPSRDARIASARGCDAEARRRRSEVSSAWGRRAPLPGRMLRRPGWAAFRAGRPQGPPESRRKARTRSDRRRKARSEAAPLGVVGRLAARRGGDRGRKARIGTPGPEKAKPPAGMVSGPGA